MAKVAKREWTYKGEKRSAYVVRYVDAKGVRRSSQFDKFKVADAFRKKVEAEMESGTHVANQDGATVKACCLSFLENAEQRVERGQIGHGRLMIYSTAINNHIVPHIGRVKFNELTWSDLETWQRALGRLSSKTVESYMIVLKMVESHAIKRGFTKRVIVRDFKRDHGGAKIKPIRTFDVDMARAVIRAAALPCEKGQRKRVRDLTECAVHIAGFCGLRFGEIMGLTVSNLDFKNKTIRVRHNLTQWDLLKGPKTSSGLRDVPMPDHIAGLLQGWLTHHFVENDRDLVFRSRTGKRITSGNWLQWNWHPVLKKAGLLKGDGDELHFHALRHFAASWMIEHGLALPDVASLMGHSKFDMTLQVYAHPIIGGHRRHEAFTRMSGHLLSATADVPALTAPQE